MKKLSPLLTEQLKKVVDLFDLLIEAIKGFNGYLKFSAFVVISFVAISLSTDIPARLIEHLNRLDPNQVYHLLREGWLSLIGIFVLVAVFGFADRFRRNLNPGFVAGQPLNTPTSPRIPSADDLFLKERVFICFAPVYLAYARQVAAFLNEAGYQVWKMENSPVTTRLDPETEQALRRSEIVMLLLGKATPNAPNVKAEMELIQELCKPVVPILVEPLDGKLAKRFPAERCLRMDGDWAQHSAALVARLREVSAGDRSASGVNAVLAPTSGTARPLTTRRQPVKTATESPKEDAPFTVGVAVQPHQFVGRQIIVDAVRQRMHNELKSISVVADRRMGKTSLLMYLASQSAQLLPASRDSVAVYISMQDIRTHTPQAIMHLLRKRITQQAAFPLPLWSERDDGQIAALADCFEDMAAEGIRLVLFLDEWELVMAHPELNDLLEQLRMLGSHSKIGMVVGTAHDLNELTAISKFSSPFYNIFDMIPMGLMPKAEWIALVSDAYQRGKRQVTDSELRQIDELAGGHPALTQIAGSVLWQAPTLGWGPGDVRKQYEYQASSILNAIWVRLTLEERSVLRMVLGIHQTEARASLETWDGLKRRGVLTKSGKIFCKSFEKFVLDEAL